MCLPADYRARALRAVLDAAADEIRGASIDPALVTRLDAMLADARRHAVELENTLRPVPAAPAPRAQPAPRRLIGHNEPGSNVVTLRAG